ncbi:MAG: hypothetical protein IKV27_06235 [Lachnospiraceae bacterium]|nr:hypothetical protein [Lachnospiraceae bacterium]
MKQEVSKENKPAYWKCNLQDVEHTLQEVKKGKLHKLKSSAGKRPIHMIEYGSSNLPASRATLSSALGAHDYSCYADKTGKDYRPTVFLAGCIHGGEFEGTVAILNLIHLLETGVDYAGNTNSELLALADKVHLLLIPICNPDGRSRIPFDNFVGRTFHELRYYNQGTWKDGTLCGWPQCKRYFPIKDHVDYLGGYYNDDGVNIMHDDFFGHMAAETSNILDVCRLYAPDVSVLFHGGTGCKPNITVPGYVAWKAKKRNCLLIERSLRAFNAFGLEFVDNRESQLSYAKEQADIPKDFNLISAMHHCCGEMCITYESNQGLADHGTYRLNNEEIYLSHNLFIQCILEMVTEK